LQVRHKFSTLPLDLTPVAQTKVMQTRKDILRELEQQSHGAVLSKPNMRELTWGKAGADVLHCRCLA